MKKGITKAICLVTVLCLALAGCSKKETKTATTKVKSNYVVNGDFEKKKTLDPWKVQKAKGNEVDWYDRKSDATSGQGSLHFFSEQDVSFKAEQTVKELPKGSYELSCKIQGDGANHPDIYIYAEIDGKTYKEKTTINGYKKWNEPKLTKLVVNGGTAKIGISVANGPGGWGTIDDFTLKKLK
ncbi:arabinogalactan endo-1,4-beta-galactosidase [Lachnospiraceae bacterium KM106-2]|nr:arabinogalactan endo-1,4-beta-galactosidase [Lachnospiraceae bacterium KM106-2]